jgi:hypothetical protein
MVCFCCSENSRKIEDAGSCTRCFNHACNYLEYGHGENCEHCNAFYCYKHQPDHCTENNIDQFKSFPRTARKALEIISNFLQTTSPEEQYTALGHGFYFAKKLHDTRMENLFENAISEIKEIGRNNITKLTDNKASLWTFDTETRSMLIHEFNKVDQRIIQNLSAKDFKID